MRDPPARGGPRHAAGAAGGARAGDHRLQVRRAQGRVPGVRCGDPHRC